MPQEVYVWNFYMGWLRMTISQPIRREVIGASSLINSLAEAAKVGPKNTHTESVCKLT